MLVPFLIMLREGVEAALVVGIIASYMRKSNRTGWVYAIWIGVFSAVAVSLLVGAALEMLNTEFPQKQQELFEGTIGLIAVVVLSSMVLWMQNASKSLAQELRQSLDAAFSSTRNQSFVLIGLVFFSVAREGLETVFFLMAIFQQSDSVSGPIGAALGLVASVWIGFLIYRGSIHLNLARFFRLTGVFIIFVAAGILGNSIKAFHEAGLWNHLQSVAFDVSAYFPENGPVGSVFSGMFGFQDSPSVSAFGAYVVYLFGSLGFVYWAGKRSVKSM